MIILKIGGGAEINLDGIITDLAVLKEKVIIVHGANAVRDRLLEKLGIEKKVITSLSGHSSVFTDHDLIDAQLMAYAGLMNKRIVSLCQQNGINAVGLSGLDGRVISGRRNQGIKIREGSKIRIIRDLSGKPVEINLDLLNLLLDYGYTPVLTVPITDEHGHAINSENDDIVAVLQSAVHAEKIIQFIEAPGIMRNPDDPGSMIKALTRTQLQQFEESVSGRMKRKVYALIKLFDSGPCKVIVSDGRQVNPLKNALNGEGTIIQ